jgi:hypothetical protein
MLFDPLTAGGAGRSRDAGRQPFELTLGMALWFLVAPIAMPPPVLSKPVESCGAPAADRSQACSPGGVMRTSAVTFTDAHRQAAEFISYNHSIVLTPEQQKVMDEALSSIPAPCCNRFSMATCCCPCNLAKSAWGFSKFLIARQRSTALQVRAAVTEWLEFTNPKGYTGDACFTGGCARSFEDNGCGGMDEKQIHADH